MRVTSLSTEKVVASESHGGATRSMMRVAIILQVNVAFGIILLPQSLFTRTFAFISEVMFASTVWALLRSHPALTY